MDPIRLTLVRYKTSDLGTCGRLEQFYTMEPPWRDNKRRISCVPLGEYLCEWVKSPHFGWVYTLRDVPQRDNVLIHGGNLAGDKAKGWTTHSEGCILLGGYAGSLNGQDAVLASRPALRKFHQIMNESPFILKIDAQGD